MVSSLWKGRSKNFQDALFPAVMSRPDMSDSRRLKNGHTSHSAPLKLPAERQITIAARSRHDNVIGSLRLSGCISTKRQKISAVRLDDRDFTEGSQVSKASVVADWAAEKIQQRTRPFPLQRSQVKYFIDIVDRECVKHLTAFLVRRDLIRRLRVAHRSIVIIDVQL